MKITDKIVTSVTQPQQTNVLWHNPETGELKMFGNKGWEVVGGKPGDDSGDNDSSCSGTCGGYPVVEYAGLPLKPNTYYKSINVITNDITFAPLPFNETKIKNNILEYMRSYGLGEESPSVEFVIPGYCQVVLDLNKYKELNIDPQDLCLTFGLTLAVYVKMELNNNTMFAVFLCPTNQPTIDGCYYAQSDFSVSGGDVYAFESSQTMPLYLKKPIQLANIISFIDQGWFNGIPIYNIKFEKNESETSPYKVQLESNILDMMMFLLPESNVIDVVANGCTEGDAIYLLVDGTSNMSFTISALNVDVSNFTNTLEYVLDGIFDSVSFDMEVNWTNDNPPTFDGTTRHVISILDGVGCYTVTPIEETT